MVKEINRNIFQPEIAPVIFLVKTHKCGSRFCHLTIFLGFFFRTNLTSMSMITEIISAIPQPSTLTATIPVVPDCLQLVGPCKLDLKEIICLYFSDGIWNCLICLFCFHKKTLLSKDKKLFLQDSHLHSLLRHQWYQTGGPQQIGL